VDDLYPPLTPVEALLELQRLSESGDPEAAHGDADDILCRVLVGLGLKDVVEQYQRVPKWYA